MGIGTKIPGDRGGIEIIYPLTTQTFPRYFGLVITKLLRGPRGDMLR
jgi:hypothetical protein